jgi:uncharacterized alpha-E superfamily protein
MLSGIADSIYWLNRYIERSENIAHFGEVNFNLILDSPRGITQLFTDQANKCTIVRKCQADAQAKSP